MFASTSSGVLPAAAPPFPTRDDAPLLLPRAMDSRCWRMTGAMGVDDSSTSSHSSTPSTAPSVTDDGDTDSAVAMSAVNCHRLGGAQAGGARSAIGLNSVMAHDPGTPHDPPATRTGSARHRSPHGGGSHRRRSQSPEASSCVKHLTLTFAVQGVPSLDMSPRVQGWLGAVPTANATTKAKMARFPERAGCWR